MMAALAKIPCGKMSVQFMYIENRMRRDRSIHTRKYDANKISPRRGHVISLPVTISDNVLILLGIIDGHCEWRMANGVRKHRKLKSTYSFDMTQNYSEFVIYGCDRGNCNFFSHLSLHCFLQLLCAQL